MGIIATVRGFARKLVNDSNYGRVTVDRGIGANQDVPQFSDSGNDSQPLDGDLVATSSNLSHNGQSAVGYIDQKNAGIAEAGEKRIYSRNANGDVVAAVHLKNNGDIVITNSNATLTIGAYGNFDFSGGDFTVNGQKFADHMHNAGAALIDSVSGNVTGVTGDVV